MSKVTIHARQTLILADEAFLQLVVAQLVEPTFKLDSIRAITALMSAPAVRSGQ